MRCQVQEMARAERMLTDDAIADEVATYNELIPDPGELSATLFIELTDRRAAARVAAEARATSSSPCASISGRATASVSRVTGIPRDEERLTRDDITADRALPPLPVRRRSSGSSSRPRPARHRGRPPRVHRSWVELTDEQRAELAGDFAD